MSSAMMKRMFGLPVFAMSVLQYAAKVLTLPHQLTIPSDVSRRSAVEGHDMS